MRHTVKVMNMNAVLWFMSFDLIPFGRISTVQHQRKFAFDVSCSQYSLTVIKKKNTVGVWQVIGWAHMVPPTLVTP